MVFRFSFLIALVLVPFSVWCEPLDVPKTANAGSFSFIQSAAVKGHPKAEYYLATYYYHGNGTAVDKEAAAFWFKKSAASGMAEAQLAYGLLLLSGEGVTQDKTAALDWIGKAARQGNAKAREVMQELLTYRGSVDQQLPDLVPNGTSEVGQKQYAGDSVRLEGKGVLLDQGIFGLKFSLPPVSDPLNAHPQQPTRLNQVLERLQGGTIDFIIRPSQK